MAHRGDRTEIEDCITPRTTGSLLLKSHWVPLTIPLPGGNGKIIFDLIHNSSISESSKSGRNTARSFARNLTILLPRLRLILSHSLGNMCDPQTPTKTLILSSKSLCFIKLSEDTKKKNLGVTKWFILLCANQIEKDKRYSLLMCMMHLVLEGSRKKKSI